MLINFRELNGDDQNETSAEAPRGSSENHAFRRLVHALSSGPRTPDLTRDEELALVQAWIGAGDRAALERLSRAFMPLLAQMSRRVARHNGCEHHLEDILQAGIAEFIAGLPCFDPDQDSRLASFIIYRVSGAMLRLCLDLKLPMRTATSSAERKAFYRYHAAIDAFTTKQGRAPTDGPSDIARIAAGLGVPAAAVRRARRTHTAKVFQIETVELWVDQETRDDTERLRDLLQGEIEALRGAISARDFAIAMKSFAADSAAVSGQIAREHDLTIERIGQIRRAALAFIRDSLRRKGITRLDDLMDVA